MLEAVRKLQVQSAKSAVSPEGRRRVQAEKDVVWLGDVASGKILWKMQNGSGEVLCVAFSPDGRMVAAGSVGGTIHLIEAATGKLLLSIRGHKVGVVGLSFSGDGKMLKTIDSGNTVNVWDLATGKKLQ
jgi:WD40 repeat protein